MECAGQLRVRASDEAQDLTRVVDVELGLNWSRRARLRAELRVEGPGRSVVGWADLLLSFLDGVGGAVDADSEYTAPGERVFMSARVRSPSI